MSKRPFQVMDEMNVADEANKTSMVAICPDFIGADKSKKGAVVKMGAPESVLFDLISEKTMPVLLLLNRVEYFKRMEEKEITSECVVPAISFDQAIDEVGALYERTKDILNGISFGRPASWQNEIVQALDGVRQLRDYACVALQKTYGIKVGSDMQANGATATEVK